MAPGDEETSTVMIVGESAFTRRVVRAALSALGVDVIEVSGGVQALSQVSADLDLMICDLSMRDMNGVELLDALTRSAALTFPVLMLSVHDQQSVVRQARKRGASGWLRKPVRPQTLAAAAQALLAHPNHPWPPVGVVPR